MPKSWPDPENSHWGRRKTPHPGPNRGWKSPNKDIVRQKYPCWSIIQTFPKLTGNEHRPVKKSRFNPGASRLAAAPSEGGNSAFLALPQDEAH